MVVVFVEKFGGKEGRKEEHNTHTHDKMRRNLEEITLVHVNLWKEIDELGWGEVLRASIDCPGGVNEFTTLVERMPFTERELLGTFLSLVVQPLKRVYSYAVPNAEAIQLISKHSGQGVVEIGAGTGLWAACLHEHGVQVQAFDICPPDTDKHRILRTCSVVDPPVRSQGIYNEYHFSCLQIMSASKQLFEFKGHCGTFFPVQQGGHCAIVQSACYAQSSSKIKDKKTVLMESTSNKEFQNVCGSNKRRSTENYVGETRTLLLCW